MKVGRVIRLLFVIKSFLCGEAHPLINVVPIELTTLSLCKLCGKGRGCSPWNGIVKKTIVSIKEENHQLQLLQEFCMIHTTFKGRHVISWHWLLVGGCLLSIFQKNSVMDKEFYIWDDKPKYVEAPTKYQPMIDWLPSLCYSLDFSWSSGSEKWYHQGLFHLRNLETLLNCPTYWVGKHLLRRSLRYFVPKLCWWLHWRHWLVAF